MEFSELISSRESVRDYDPDKIVPKQVLLKILNAGRMAPSAGNRQPWEFIVISTAKMLERVRQSYHREWFHDAPHILVVKGWPGSAWLRASDGYNSLETDLAIAMDHMILAAENEGVGTCWIIAFDPEVLFEALKVKEDEIVYAITPLGYPRKGYTKGEKIRKSEKEVFRFI